MWALVPTKTKTAAGYALAVASIFPVQALALVPTNHEIAAPTTQARNFGFMFNYVIRNHEEQSDAVIPCRYWHLCEPDSSSRSPWRLWRSICRMPIANAESMDCFVADAPRNDDFVMFRAD